MMLILVSLKVKAYSFLVCVIMQLMCFLFVKSVVGIFLCEAEKGPRAHNLTLISQTSIYAIIYI